jgi:hypothetical protein
MFSFSRIDALRRHAENSHLKYFICDSKFLCPYPVYSESVEGIMHFKNHAPAGSVTLVIPLD